MTKERKHSEKGRKDMKMLVAIRSHCNVRDVRNYLMPLPKKYSRLMMRIMIITIVQMM